MPKELTLPEVEMLPEVTRAQAQEWDRLQRAGAVQQRIALYLIHAHKAWKQIGAKDFEDYCEKRTDVDRTTVYRWIWQIDMTCRIQQISSSDLLQFATNEKGDQDAKLLPGYYVPILTDLPSDEMRREAWKQFTAIRAGRMVPEGETYVRSLQQIVSNMLKAHALPPPTKSRGKSTKQSDTPSGASTSTTTQQNPPAPSAFDQATEGTSEHSASTPAPPQTPAPPKQQTVTSFTPKPDPDSQTGDVAAQPEPIECPDADAVEVAFDTALVWAKNKSIEDSSSTRKKQVAVIKQFLAWEEQQP